MPANFLWTAFLLLSGALSFDFCYDLDLCSQSQAVRAFSIRMGFSLILSKAQGGFWLNIIKKIFANLGVNLSYPYFYLQKMEAEEPTEIKEIMLADIPVRLMKNM